jgi:hypothetical protein
MFNFLSGHNENEQKNPVFNLNFRESSCYRTHNKVQQTLRPFAHTLRTISQKQLLFPYTALTEWFYNRDECVFTARY